VIQILHAADLHLDAPFASLPPDQAAQRREEQRGLLARLAQQAREGGADLVFLAGDLFDSGQVYPETLQALARALAQTGCPVFIAPGNHDYYGPKSPYVLQSWPENVHIFSAPEMTGVALQALNCVVWGCAFTSPTREDGPLAGFSAPRDGRVHLGVLHGDLAPASPYGPITQEQIGESGLTYLALGHIHKSDGFHAAATPWAYPGCPEGRGFDELGDKGALWVKVEDHGVTAEFLPMAARRYHILEIPAGEDAAAAVDKALTGEYREDICRVILTGEYDPEGVDLAALEGAFSPRCYALQLRDATVPRRDLWDRAGEDSLTGLFLRRMEERLAQAPDTERETLELAVRYGLAALERREEPRV